MQARLPHTNDETLPYSDFTSLTLHVTTRVLHFSAVKRHFHQKHIFILHLEAADRHGGALSKGVNVILTPLRNRNPGAPVKDLLAFNKWIDDLRSNKKGALGCPKLPQPACLLTYTAQVVRQRFWKSPEKILNDLWDVNPQALPSVTGLLDHTTPSCAPTCSTQENRCQ